MVKTWPGFITPTALFSGERCRISPVSIRTRARRDAGIRLLTGVMWHVGGSVEKPVDAVAAVAPHHREAAGLGVFLDDVAQLPVADARLHCGAERRRRFAAQNWCMEGVQVNVTARGPVPESMACIRHSYVV